MLQERETPTDSIQTGPKTALLTQLLPQKCITKATLDPNVTTNICIYSAFRNILRVNFQLCQRAVIQTSDFLNTET